MAKSIPDYFDRHPQWRAELDYLRNLLLSTDLAETLKWGIPTYTINNKNVVGLGAFKSYVGLWFFQGVFLSDHANCLINAQEGTTKGMRQWRFQSISEINAALVLSYLEEAIQNQREGKEIKTEKKQIPMPELLQQALDGDAQLSSAFAQFSPGKQKEFKQYIADAKRDETKHKRIAKISPMILEGVGLNDKYR